MTICCLLLLYVCKVHIKTFYENIFVFRFNQNYAKGLGKLGTNRHIQLLANLLNEIQQKVMIPLTMCEGIVVLGESLAILVCITATPSNIFILTLLAFRKFCSFSFPLVGLPAFTKNLEWSHKSFILSCRMLIKEERQWTRRFLKSCEVIKMKFGRHNCVDELATLNCLGHDALVTV